MFFMTSCLKLKPLKASIQPCRLLLLGTFLSYSSTLKMEAICSSETSVSLRTTCRYKTEHHTLNI
jgi:hypothetical protein